MFLYGADRYGADNGANGPDDVIVFGPRSRGRDDDRRPRDVTPHGGGRTGRVIASAACLIAVATLIMSGGALVRSAVIVRVTGRGMQTTVGPGDDVIVARTSTIHRGDIVVLPGQAGSQVITRVIAVPGDQVACCDAAGRVMVDGRSLDWDDVPLSEQPSGTAYSLTLGSGQIWVLGDNRASATDSRTWGPLDLSEVEGRAIASWHGGVFRLLRTPGAFARDGLAPASSAVPVAVEGPAAAAAAAVAVLVVLAMIHLARRLLGGASRRA